MNRRGLLVGAFWAFLAALVLFAKLCSAEPCRPGLVTEVRGSSDGAPLVVVHLEAIDFGRSACAAATTWSGVSWSVSRCVGDVCRAYPFRTYAAGPGRIWFRPGPRGLYLVSAVPSGPGSIAATARFRRGR